MLEKENLLGKGDGDGSDGDGEEQLDEFGRVIVKDSHQFAKLQHQVDIVTDEVVDKMK